MYASNLYNVTCQTYFNFKKLKINHPFRKSQDMKRFFTREDIQMANNHMKTYLTLLANREMQIKITIRYHNIPIKTVKMKYSDNLEYWQI